MLEQYCSFWPFPGVGGRVSPLNTIHMQNQPRVLIQFQKGSIRGGQPHELYTHLETHAFPPQMLTGQILCFKKNLEFTVTISLLYI